MVEARCNKLERYRSENADLWLKTSIDGRTLQDKRYTGCEDYREEGLSSPSLKGRLGEERA